MNIFYRSCLLFVCTLIITSASSAQVKCGIDNLIDTEFEMLRGSSVVLVTHAAARTFRGTSTAEEFIGCKDLRTLRVLAPEHGYYGVVAAGIHVANDSVQGIPVVSLYGPKRRPDADMLAGATAVVVDLQDIGVRSYTYISTMVEVMEACAELNIRCVILDRPNPLGGITVEGNLPDDTLRSFIGRLPIPYIHGLTMGELATMTNESGWLEKSRAGTALRCSLTVVRCKRWRRTMMWHDTQLSWYPTSPNIPTFESVRGYALTGLLGELGPCSIGIGTTMPFTVIGAPDFVQDSFIVATCKRYGVVAARSKFVPMVAKYANTVCEGYHLEPTQSWQPYSVAIALLWRMRQLRPDAFATSLVQRPHGKMFAKACGSTELLKALIEGKPLSACEKIADMGVEEFKKRRSAFLLYD